MAGRCVGPPDEAARKARRRPGRAEAKKERPSAPIATEHPGEDVGDRFGVATFRRGSMRHEVCWKAHGMRRDGRILIATLVLGACAPPVSAVSVGPPRYPRASNCAIREESLTPKDAENRYIQVGVVCWSSDRQTREQRDRAACGLGGDLVVAIGLCMNDQGRSARQGTEYGVYIEK
jgi:hypothetical protein